MGEFAVRLVAALWHVVGFLVLVVLFAEFGVDWLRRAIRRLRRGRTTRPARSAGADAYGGADWTTPYFDEFSRSVQGRLEGTCRLVAAAAPRPIRDDR